MQPLDAIDRQIIAALRIDARKPVSRLASALGIARATAEKRLARMIDSGTILGFTVRARDDTPATVREVMLIAVAGRSTAAVNGGHQGLHELDGSEERRVGNGGVSQGRVRGSPSN